MTHIFIVWQKLGDHTPEHDLLACFADRETARQMCAWMQHYEPDYTFWTDDERIR